MTVIIFFAILGLPYLVEAETPYKPDEIVVKFKSGVSEVEIEAIVMSNGASIIEHIEELNVYRLSIPGGISVPEMVDLFGQDPRCEYAEPNYIGQGGDFFPNDTFFPQQWHLHNIGQTGGTVDADIDAVEGWEIATGSSSIVVAVLDSGIDSDHLEFQGRILPGFDFLDGDSDPEAERHHGVSVAGIIAANTNNSFSIAGLDLKVKILPVRIINSGGKGTTTELANGLIFAADQGAHVINMSLIDYPTSSPTLDNALQYARDAGSILIACAGNGGIGNADVSGPGASPFTISVGATDHDDARAIFSATQSSGTGAALDVVAPGLSLSTVSFDNSRDVVRNFSGCSAATPVVSGIATLLLSLNHSLTHNQIRNILTTTAEDEVGPAAEDAPGRDDFFGHGRVNMNVALLVASARTWTDSETGDIWTTDPRACGARVDTWGASWAKILSWTNAQNGDVWTTDPRATGPRVNFEGCPWVRILVWVNPATGAIWTTAPNAVGPKATGWGHNWTNTNP
jgi:subtilisin family serine protease